MSESNTNKRSFVEKLAEFIVDKRNFIFFAFAVICAFCVVTRNWVEVNDDITAYLDKDSETTRGLEIMDAEFKEYATARVMVANVTYERALELQETIERIPGVHGVEFDDSSSHYASASALFEVTFDGDTTASISESALDDIKDTLSGYDLYVSSDVGNPLEQTIQSEMVIVLIIAVVIIIVVLLFTSHTYAEVPVLLITFGAAALLNMGTNYWFGTISYITNSIAVVLQLALAIDYAIILCHRYTEERETKDARSAVIAALSKAIPEISASSLTTISGLAALTLMHFRLGYDMGIVLIKAIIMSMISVFFLMPGLLMLFSGLIDKTHHKNFVPKISALGHMAVKTRYVVPPAFILIAVAAFIFSSRCPYVYGYSTLDTIKQSEAKIAEKLIDSTFGTENFIAMVVPSGDYEKEKNLISALESIDEVSSVLGLANTEALDGYTVTAALTPRQFAELMDLSIEQARVLYAAYAVEQGEYGKVVSALDEYQIPLIDLFFYLYDMEQSGLITLDDETSEQLSDAHEQLEFGQSQLEGENYSRFVVYLNLPEESEETFAFLDTLHMVAERYYDDVTLVGESVNERDLKSSFSEDNLLISILSALFVIVVLLFTFRSVGLPILLIIVIQSSIWINFSVPYLTNSNLFFISYLIVSAIQMGANIDYAIVISSRYMDLKSTMHPKEAIVEALNQAFPTIITSGLMLASAGVIIGFMTSDNTIASIGICLGRGTLISIILVMCVLPQFLLLGDIIIEKTAFSFKRPELTHIESSTVRIHGRVRGQISGFVDADIRGVFQGSINAMVESGAATTLEHQEELESGSDYEYTPPDTAGEAENGDNAEEGGEEK